MLTLLSLALLAESHEHDLVIYGGTSAAVIAAMQAQAEGVDVVVVSPDEHLGGLTSGGLGWTDSGKKEAIGGLSRQFYRDIKSHYDDPDHWTRQTRDEYLTHPRFAARPPITDDAFWVFEPSVAEAIFERYVAERGLVVHRGRGFRLDRSEDGTTVEDGRIASFRTVNGDTFAGRIFIDATYEGDLMAAAGVSYHVGRESNATYGETLNGFQPLRRDGDGWTGTVKHQFFLLGADKRSGAIIPVSALRDPGDSTSGLLPFVDEQPKLSPGDGDHRIQAYCFRMCLTDDPENLVPWPKPEGYDPLAYELLARVMDTGWRGMWNKFDPAPNRKTDTNNHGPLSTDFIGQNYDYPEAPYERREQIIAEHERYQKGLMWFLANDPRSPADVRERMSQWGLAADEFPDNGHWPHQIYVREARRMIGPVVMSERRIQGYEPVPQPIGMGSYNMDSHNVQRYAQPVGGPFVMGNQALNEGDIQVNPGGPYPISYQAITPKRSECENLLVPVACSASHIAYGSIRMEPVFMILGQSAASAAAIALADGSAVQNVPYDRLKARLEADGQVLDLPNSTARMKRLDLAALGGRAQDDREADWSGSWTESRSTTPYAGRGYRATDQSGATATFTLPAPEGDATVHLIGPPHPNRCSRVAVTAAAAGQTIEAMVDQRTGEPAQPIGTLSGLAAGDEITITVTAGDGGYTVVDAVWVE